MSLEVPATQQFNRTPVRLTDRRFLEGHELTLDSDAVKHVNAYGRFFLVRSANVPFQMSVNGGRWFEIEQGEGFDLGDTDRFTKLSFRRVPGDNADVEVKFRTADCNMFDARLNIVRDPNQIQIITQFPAPSYAVREFPVALPELQTPEDDTNKLVLPGILTRGVWPCAPAANWLYALPSGVNRAIRKSLRIESDEELDLLWWNGVQADIGDGVKLATVPMATTAPFYEETSQDVVLVNPGAAAATIAILALFDVPVWYSPTSEDP